MSAEDEVIVRRTYTRARRFTQWVRWVMGYQLPVALQAAQFVTGVGTLALLIQTRAYWAGGMPWSLQILLILGLPVAVGVATRYLRTDGTGPAAVAAGLLSLATAPISGRVNGRTLTLPRAHRAPAFYSVLIDIDELARVADAAAATRWPGSPAAPATTPTATTSSAAAPAGAPHRASAPGPRRAPAAATAPGPRLVSVAELTRAATALANGEFRHGPEVSSHESGQPPLRTASGH
ncbi:hypothetical protein [Kutzneria buriramensis]|uniref:Uncharacterized protein n=1 Tax=Kutzneria buriramensis TaxID=1045776 RepID=A0A3E0GVY4_9PSEU|nr:hypothetical protein [Kutzneria buriramensis]REH31027.1 hypothetical protein BCF44_12250 [Kutzneria buriramensis]